MRTGSSTVHSFNHARLGGLNAGKTSGFILLGSITEHPQPDHPRVSPPTPLARPDKTDPLSLGDATAAHAGTTIVLAEDHGRLRDALRQLLQKETDFHLVGEAGDGRETVRLAIELHPDLLVTDLAMPGLHGLEVIRRVKEECPRTCIVVATINQDEPYVIASFRNGALGYVHKGACGAHLVPAIRSALSGTPYLSPPFGERVLKQALSDEATGGLDIYETLTSKERLALQLAGGSHDTAEIATALGICQAAARILVDNLMRKLGLVSQADVVHYARAKGLTSGLNEF